MSLFVVGLPVQAARGEARDAQQAVPPSIRDALPGPSALCSMDRCGAGEDWAERGGEQRGGE